MASSEISVIGAVKRTGNDSRFPLAMIAVKVEPETGVRLLTLENAVKLITDLRQAVDVITPEDELRPGKYNIEEYDAE